MSTNVQLPHTKIDQLLDSILHRNDLRFSDGRPLYAYRVDSVELEDLKIALASQIKLVANLRTVKEKAAFCLFGAESFRRHYAGGPYSWDVIFYYLGCDDKTTQYLKRTVREVADDGLRWWKIDVIRSAYDSQFRLKTIACHGGFPNHVLSNNAAILRRYLCDILRSYEQYDQPISDVVASMNSLLPETINQPVVHDLAATLVTSLAILRRTSESANERGLSRRDYLDQFDPGWSARLPLNVVEESSQQILLSLLDTQRVYTSERKPFVIRTSLRLTSKRAELIRQLHFPQRSSIDGFRQSLGMQADKEIPSRISGYLVSGHRSEHCMSIVRFSDGKDLQLRPMGDASVVVQSQTSDVRLSLESGIEQIASVSVPGGEALPASPWVFQNVESGDWVGDGSLRTRHKSVIVAIPVDAVQNTSEAETIETLEQTLLGRQLVQFSGRLSITLGDSLFRIQTESDDVSELSFELCGPNCHLGLGGQTVWIGPPSVRYTNTMNPDAIPTSVHDNAIQWRPHSGGSWRSMNEQCVGDIVIRVDEDGTTRFLANATVFPTGFSFHVLPGNHHGSIRLHSVSAKAVWVARYDSVASKCTQNGNDWEINISINGKRPSTIKAKIEFETAGVADVSFVCPTEVCSIVDATGEEVQSDRAIPLDRLDGLRLQVVDPRDRAGFLYSMEEMLLIEQLRPTEIKGVSQMPLSLIQNAAKEILGKSRQNDVKIEFGLIYRADIKASFIFSVKRYSRELKRREHHLADKNIIQVFLEHSDSAPAVEGLVVAPIADPFSDSCCHAVNRDGECTWNVDADKLAPGGYLLHVQNRGRETIRPLLITINKSDIPQVDFEKVPLEEQFTAVSNMIDHLSRPAAWGRLIAMMVANLSHPAWVKLDALIASSQEMPITTFESIVALAGHPAAIVRIGMHNPGKARLWERLEELPFLWSLVPIGTWISTAKQLIATTKELLSNAGVTQEIIDQNVKLRIDDFAKNAPLRCQSLSCVVALMKYGVGFPINEDSAADCMACTQIRDLENEHRNLMASVGRIDKRIRWPELRLDVSNFIQCKLNEVNGLQTTDMKSYQVPVCNAPLVAAVHCVYDIPTTDKQLATFRSLRSFNLPWYENANRIAVHLLAEGRFRSDPEWAESLRAT
ncbi:MAG: STY4851/ECs_5259 family protein [Pirellula sp.]